ncbi:MAG: protein kinase [Polyangiaceae bacterium]|nr:protein kinase [Polyangiaceae bacterium]
MTLRSFPPDDEETMTRGDETSASERAFLKALAHISDMVPAPPVPVGTQALGHLQDKEGRFAIQKRIGSGGFGTVYEVIDRASGASVALKVMRRRDAHALYLFKQEFRALAGMAHPQLVQLYELHADEERWFYTMELVRGHDVLQYVRAAPGASISYNFNEERLRSALGQLARGIDFLHEAGKLHRDIKPSNIMVDSGGTVKILDFGLITAIESVSDAGFVAGTPHYMAPEQAAGLPVGPAADWYSMGVVLYQALTGEIPPSKEPPPPSRYRAGVPADLERLCLDLLAQNPSDRPDGRAIRRRLDPAAAVKQDRGAQVGQPFVGRAEELRTLETALADARAGRTAVALVHGPSGMGKSSLVARFLETIQANSEGPVALSGRCFEQESVPHKALDHLVDSLCRRLASIPTDAVARSFSEEIGVLARLFPVLRRISAIEAAREEELTALDHRARAAFALRSLLGHVGQPPPVLFIDDLQWGDLDSMKLLLELLRAPGSPLLLIVTYRTEEAATSPVLQAFLYGLREVDGASVRDMPVGELAPAEALALAEALLPQCLAPERRKRASDIAVEGRGHPFFITEHARAVRLDASASGGLDALLNARIERLAEPARRLLEVVSTAGQPIARPIAARAAGLDKGEIAEPHAVALLCAGQLLRVQWARDRPELLPYHDRIGAAVSARLKPEARREVHAELALALEDAGGEAADLALHFREAGQPERAARYAIQAADQAAQALAFERAARLYREALALGMPEEEIAARGLRIRLADALASAGRPREAAEAYLEAAAREPPARALSLRRKAMERLLAGGYLDEGLEVLDRVLGELGISRPKTNLEALALLVKRRLKLALRGLDAGARPARQIPERTVLAIDACGSAAGCLSIVDPLSGAALHAEHLTRALEAGDPVQLSRALRLEAVMRTFFSGGRGPHAAEALLRRAAALGQETSEPEEGLGLLVAFMLAQLRGEVSSSEPLLRRGLELIERNPAASTWQRDLASSVRTQTLWLLGEIPELAASMPRLVAEARERGNRYHETMLRLTGEIFVALADDRPAFAEEAVRSTMARWSRDGFHLQHFRALLARVRIALYIGEGRRALRLLLAAWPSLLRTGQLVAPAVRSQACFLRAVAALAAHRQGGGVALLTLAAHDARSLMHLEVAWARPSATLIRGAIAAARGLRRDALDRSKDAENAFGSLHFELPRMAARRLHGLELGGAEGRDLVASSDAWMEERGIRRPDRIAALFTGR